MALVQLACELAGGLRGLAVDFKNHIARLKARFIRGAGRAHIFNHNAMNLVRRVDLLPRFCRQVGHCESELSGLLAA